MDPPVYVRQGTVDLLHAFQVSLSCWPHVAPPPADDMLAVEITLRDVLAGEAAASHFAIAEHGVRFALYAFQRGLRPDFP